jgi:FkbM family methyltransferase
MNKKILIAIPTARYIEADTFKSIYDLEIPEGYKTTFQYFYGYRIDQIRNLIAEWVVNYNFDYLFAVDHDITFPPDTLKKMLSHDVPVITGVYRQRLPVHKIEIYDTNLHRMDISQVYNRGLIEIGGCGFGCILIKREVMVDIGYPQFEYHVTKDFSKTLSEDNDFCLKARKKGYKIYCDSSIMCGHIGSTIMYVEIPEDNIDPVQKRFKELRTKMSIPAAHKDFLVKLNSEGVNPKVIYDIGACVLHWHDAAKKVWPNAQIIPFETMHEVATFYENNNVVPYVCGYILSNISGELVEFYQNLQHPFENSVFKKNPELSPLSKEIFTEDNKIMKYTITLDELVEKHNLPLPDMIKMSVQGSELNILKGAVNTIKNCNHIMLSLQHENYNIGAPLANEVISYMRELGFETDGIFCNGPLDVNKDYYFYKVI